MNNPPALPLIIPLESITRRLCLADIFPVAQPLEVELGSGDGNFLVEYARRHPDRNFIGVERLLGRLRKLDRKGHRLGLVNLRGVRLEAGYFVRYLLPAGSVAVFHLYFPDPWPKKKHHHHRLVNLEFTQAVQQALEPGGRLYLRTDSADYHAWIKAVFAQNPDFAEIETPRDLQALHTDFEREFNQRGMPTLHAAWRRGG